MKCPMCSKENSQIPMTIDEVCYMEFSNIRGPYRGRLCMRTRKTGESL
jgi:hypothetical protein